jgi:hypothetical protein
MRVIHFPVSMTVAMQEVRYRLRAREVARAIGLLMVGLLLVLVLWAALMAVLVGLVMRAHGQETVVGEHYDHLAHEFPAGVEGHCWKDGKSGYCFHGGHWVPSKPVVIMAPKSTPMYECPYGQHYHPLAKDVVPGDAEMWKHPDTETQTKLPALTGACFSIDFDEQLSPRGKRIK